MIVTRHAPDRDTVIYDGRCRFCRGQIALLRACDVGKWLAFTSLHEPEVATTFPELSRDDLLAQIYVIDRQGRARGGAEALRYLSRRLPTLWPLAIPLHIPGSLPLWQWLYGIVARNRFRIAGSCADGSCELK